MTARTWGSPQPSPRPLEPRSDQWTPPTSVLHGLADLVAHGVDEAGGGCAVHPATQGQEKPSLQRANKGSVSRASEEQRAPNLAQLHPETWGRKDALHTSDGFSRRKRDLSL